MAPAAHIQQRDNMKTEHKYVVVTSEGDHIRSYHSLTAAALYMEAHLDKASTAHKIDSYNLISNLSSEESAELIELRLNAAAKTTSNKGTK
jgi:hypothetical protein